MINLALGRLIACNVSPATPATPATPASVAAVVTHLDGPLEVLLVLRVTSFTGKAIGFPSDCTRCTFG